jgi:hypothetical protein
VSDVYLLIVHTVQVAASAAGEHAPCDSVVGLVSYGMDERVEFVVYNSKQTYPEFMVECRAVQQQQQQHSASR